MYILNKIDTYSTTAQSHESSRQGHLPGDTLVGYCHTSSKGG
jgi:hypothetical protein